MLQVRKNLSEIDVLPLEAVAFGRVEYPPGGGFGPRVQADVQLVIVDAGSARITTDGRTREIGPGEVACQWPGPTERFAFDDRTRTVHRWIALSPLDGGAAENWIASKRQTAVANRKESGVMRRLFDAAFALPADDPSADTGRTYLGLAYLTAYLQISANQSADATRPPPPPALTAMLHLIANRSADPLTLDDLASAASVTPNHLVRLCRQHFDTTPMKLLWNRRVEQGAELLRGTGLTVAEIAFRVGFADPFHFSRRCRVRYGRSPREVRAAAWGGRARYDAG